MMGTDLEEERRERRWEIDGDGSLDVWVKECENDGDGSLVF